MKNEKWPTPKPKVQAYVNAVCPSVSRFSTDRDCENACNTRVRRVTMHPTKLYEQNTYVSSAYRGRLCLGTVEKDAQGGYGAYSPEAVRGERILLRLLQEDFQTVLDVGAGALSHSQILVRAGKTVDTVDFGKSDYSARRTVGTRVRNEYVGDFNELKFSELYDCVWCSHILEHQLNPNAFLRKLHSIVKEDGIVAIVVPPRKPFIVDGHVSLWNAGLLLYHLVLAGFDCSKDLWIRQYDYNIGVILRKKSIPREEWPKDLCMDTGDLHKLSKFFPEDLPISKNMNGDIFCYPREDLPRLKIAVLIPARYGSTRFPGKALCKLNGIPMAKRVYNRCIAANFDTYLVSDDERICELVENSIMTSSSCENGTSRCAEAAKQLDSYDAFINVQGDMPDISVEIIQTIAEALESDGLVTAYTEMSANECMNPHSVKLIHDGTRAIWSCRAAIKYGYHHLGVYGYHKTILSEYSSLPRCPAEIDEGLEQLRWLNAGYFMRVVSVEFSGTEINTSEDVDTWKTKEKLRT